MLGIAGAGLALTGPEVDAMSADQLKKVAPECNIYARASPENKIRIVRALQVREWRGGLAPSWGPWFLSLAQGRGGVLWGWGFRATFLGEMN
jgi:hypothetical protein